MYSDTIETHKVSGGFEQGKEFPEARQKVRIQEFGNNGDLNILWQLFEEIFILFITDCQTFVFVPLVLKEILDFLLELFWELLAKVQALNQSKERCKLLGVFHLAVKSLHFLYHLIEHSNNVTKYGITKQNDASAKQPLEIVYGMVVSESYSWQGCEGEVRHYYGNVLFFL